MKETIQQLDSLLSTVRPEFYGYLKEPLDTGEIERLTAEYQCKLPPDLLALYTWKNGQEDSCFEAFVNNSTFIPLEEALEIAKENTSMIELDFEIENWWNENWIPIFHNGGGDYICYDRAGVFTGRKGQLIEFWHADNDRNVVAPSLGSFLEKLKEYYENTPEEDFDEYFQIASPDNYPQRFTVE